STSHTQTITVEDTVAPVFNESLPTNVTVSCSEVPTAVTLTATDNCDTDVEVNYSENITGQDDACGSSYVIVRSWEVSDCSGNSTSHTQTITVEDTVAPVFNESLPIDVTVSCSEVPAAVTLTATDNCDTDVVVNYSENISGQDDACGSSYVIVRSWEVSDCSGNSTSHTQTITVEDTEAPVFNESLPTDVTVSCSEVPAAVTLTATDNCDIDVVVNYSENISGQDDACGSSYVIVRSWEVSDCSGNSTSHTQTITVEDTEAPVFNESLPTDVTVSCSEVPAAVTLTATDNCDTDVVVNYSENISGQDDACGSSYVIVRSWEVSDCSGNSTSHTQTITVEDTEAPVFNESLPTDVTVSCSEVPVAVTLTATDNCDTDVVVNYSENITGQDDACGSSYVIVRSWEVSDCSGNSTSHTQTITVEDTEAPELVTELQDISVTCDEIPEVPELEFTDNCSDTIIVDSFEETNTFDSSSNDYEIIREWIVSDTCGNSAIFSQIIYVSSSSSIIEFTDERCIDDGTINLNQYLVNGETGGEWIVSSGNTSVSDNIFDPSTGDLGIYEFTYNTLSGGCTSSVVVTIDINNDCLVLPCGQEDVDISKAVTPNGDEHNEFFEVAGVGECGFIIDVQIFNRWGARVYQSKNYQNNWNGRSTNSSFGSHNFLPAGTYYYIVTLKNSGLKPFTGAIYLGTN
ncbi:gliding motility-associated C-terminal domain-containing protein, partial [Tenacibaculum geojense]